MLVVWRNHWRLKRSDTEQKTDPFGVPAASQPAPGAAVQAAALRSEPLPNFDRRIDRSSQDAPPASAAPGRSDRQAAADRLRALVPGVRVDFDQTLGSPAFIASTEGFLATANGSAGAVPAARLEQFAPDDAQRLVKAFIDEHAALFGHDSSALAEAKLVRDYDTPHNGMHTFVWQQELDGVRVFESTLQAHLTRGGDLVNMASRFVPDAAGSAPDRTAALAAPKIDAKTAVSAAGANVGEKVPVAQIAENAPPAGPARKQQFRSSRLLDVNAEQVWLPENGKTLRLCWEVTFTSKARGEMFRSLVDAETGTVLVRQGLTEYISAASYRVFTSDSPSPMSPGLATPGTTQPAEVARTLVTIDAFDTTASPNGWIDDGVNETRGNNVDAHLDLNADDIADTPRPQGSPSRVFDFTFDSTQAPTAYQNAAVTQLFYWNNYIHDRYYQLGFTEAAGNFQNNNFGKGGSANDAVQADAQDGSGTNNANFSTPSDGSPGRMQMYVFTGPTPDRDGDFDQEVVIHEYTHGLSNRLVGGGVGISSLQPRGMGEGWSDFYALCLLSQPADDPNAVYAAGAYASYQLSGLTQNYYYGIRRYPYCTDLAKNPLTFKDIDPTLASAHTGVPKSPIAGSTANEVHNMGEVWCVTLWEARANLIAKLGATAGNNLILRLVTDGMKLAPANPNFLQARDGVIQADLVNNAGANRSELWAAFARRGMGASATSPSSATTTGLVEAFDSPFNLVVTLPASVTEGDASATGTVTANPTPSTDLTVTLTNSDPAQVTVPGSVIIAAGQASATFAVTAVNDTQLDGSPTVTVSPSSAGYSAIPGSTVAIDNETTTLAITLPSAAMEGTTGLTGTVTTAAAVGAAVAVKLTSNDTTELRVPPTVTIPAGGNSATFALTIVDDLTVDGPQVATLTASVTGWTPASQAMVVNDNNLTSRTINAADRGWYQQDGSHTPTNPNFLTGFSSSANAEAHSFFVFSIPALAPGETILSAELRLQNPTNGFSSPDATETLQFQDATTPISTLIDGTGGVAAFTDLGNGTVFGSRTVSAADNGMTVVIPLNNAFISAATAAANGQLAIGGQLTTITRTTGIGEFIFGYSGSTQSTQLFLTISSAGLVIALPPSATEGDAPASGTVTASYAPASDLVVNLTSSSPARLSMPASITILAGTTSATFPLTINDDVLLNGTTNVTIAPSAAGWAPSSANIAIHDNETATLTVSLPASTMEGAGTVPGTIAVSTAVDTDVVVALTSSDTGEILAPANVTIPAGQTSAPFALMIVDDLRIDGPITSSVTAHVANWTDGTAAIDVLDNENVDLTLTLPASVREGDTGKTGTATISGTLPNDLVVTLSSDDSSEITVPTSVTIPAQQTSATFALTVVDDTEPDGLQTVNVNATASGFTSASAAVAVQDNDAHHFTIAPIANPQVRGVAFAVSVTAKDVNDATITNYNSTIALSATGNSGAVTISPTTASAFVNGVWTGNVTASTFATNVVLTANDGAAHTGSSIAFDVGTGPLDHFAWSTLASPQTMDTPFAATITAQDAGNNTATSFAGPANLSAVFTAQQAATGTGTSSSTMPFYGSYAKVRTQVIYLASEMSGAARLTALSLYIGTASTGTFSNWTIRLKHTNQSSYASGSWDGAGWTVVHQSSATPSTTGWLTFNFSTPFDYDGTSNLLADFSFNNSIANNLTAYCRYSSGTARAEYGYASSGDPLTWSGTSGATATITTAVPNVQFSTERTGPLRPATTGAFDGGVWTGNVSVPFVASAAALVADDGAAHRGKSNTIAVNPPPTGNGGGATVFVEDFESGSPGTAWTITGTNTYRTQVTTANAPHGGTRHLTMDSATTSSYSRNEATLSLNLAGRTGVQLTFWAKMFGDEANGPPASPFLNGADFDGVAMSADGTTWWEVQSLRSPAIGSSWAQFTVNLDAAIAARGIAYNPAFKIRFNQYDDNPITTDGIAIDDISVTAAPLDIISLSIPAQATEGAGALGGTVTLPSAQASDTVVTLASYSPAKITVPASVTVPAGQLTANFSLTVLDDSVIDGSKLVTISASAGGLNTGAAAITVLDNDTGALTLSVPASASESSGTVQGTLTLSPTVAASVVATLTSSDPSVATVPANVTFTTGQGSLAVPVTIIDDTKINGTRPVTITASVSGWTSVTGTISILDNENTNLTVNLPATTGEGNAPAAATVAISGTLASDLVVTLASSDQTEMTVPASVTIPAGQTSAAFNATIVDDTEQDGAQTATVTADASGFTTGSKTVSILDNDADHFVLSPVASPQTQEASFLLTVTAKDASDATITGFGGSVSFTAAAGGNAVPVTPAVLSGFANGVWTGPVAVLGVATGVVLTAGNTPGHNGSSNSFDVLGADYSYPENWPTFGNGPRHTGYQPVALGTASYQAGWTKTFTISSSNGAGLNQVAISNGRIFVTPYSYPEVDFLSALDASTGTELWRKSFTAASSINPPTVNAGKVYTQRCNNSGDSQLWALNAASGATVWSAPFGAQWDDYAAPTVVGDGVWVDGGTYGGLYGFNTSNGSQRFFNSTLGQYDGWTPAYDNGTVYTWVSGVFRAHDPATGNILWSSTLSSSVAGTPVVDGGKAFVLTSSNLYAINLLTHTTAWTLSGTFKGTPAAANGVVYALSGSDVKAYHSQTGAVVGTYSTGNSSISGQPIVTADSLIVTSSTNTYIFNLWNAALKQILSNGGTPSLANGVLYLAGSDGVLRTFYVGGPPTINLAAPALVNEGNAPQTATVSLSKVLTSSTVISLSSSNPARLSVPPSVTIPANQTTVTFRFNIIDDSLVNGPENITITARAPTDPVQPGTATVTVNDNEAAALTVNAPVSTMEGTTVQATVSLSAVPTRDITVALGSNDQTEVFLMPSVTIPAGQTSATFNIMALDDGIADGTQTVTLTARVSGWVDGTALLDVLDSGQAITTDWPTFGNGPSHTGYQPINLANVTFQAGWARSAMGLTQVAVSNGRVFSSIGSPTALSVLESSTGTELWRKTFTSASSLNPPTVNAGRVYVQRVNNSSDTQLWSLDANSGATAWSAPFGAQWDAYDAPTVVDGGVWIAGGTYGGLYGFNTSGGSQRFFNSSLEQYDEWTPTYYNGTIYTWVEGNFRAHDPTTGAILWTLDEGWSWHGWSMQTVAAIDAGKAFVVGSPNFYAIDLLTHTTAWTATGSFKGSPAVASGVVYALTGSDVKAYHAQTGALIGTYSTGNTSISGQPIVTNDALIVSGSANTYIFDLQTFALQQTLASGGVASLANGVIYLAGSDGVLRTFRPAGQTMISLSLPASVLEGSPALAGAVTLSAAQSSDTHITLLSSDPARLGVPGSVTIPAGQTTAAFQATVVNDSLLNGSETIAVTAKASSYMFYAGFTAVIVNDDETATIAMNVPTSAKEGATNVWGSVALSGAPAANVAISLSSSDTTEVTVPGTVIVLAGQTSATFPITIVNDTEIDGTQAATITASVTGWTGGSGTINILDNETSTLSLSGASSVNEGSTGSGTVTISGTLPANLVVSLASANTSRLTVPATVTIPAGSTSASFTLTGGDNSLTDGAASVNVTASASGFTSGSRAVTVYDNEIHHFSVSSIGTSQIANVAFSVYFYARSVDDYTISGFAGSATLSVSAGGSSLPVTPSSVTFSSGYASTSVSVNGTGAGATLAINDGAAHTGTSNSFNLGIGPLHHFALSTIGTPQTVGTSFPVTITAKDAYNNTVPTFTSSATLNAGPTSAVSGTGTSFYTFILGTSTQQRNQAIYLASEIGSAGKITSLAFQSYVYSIGTLGNFTVRLKHTSLDSYGVSPGWDASGWTTVYQGSLPVTTTGTGWINLPLSTPFQYDGTSNLMVDITHNGTGVDGYSLATSKSNTRTLSYSGSGYADPLTWSGTSNPTPFTSTGLPNLRVQLERAVPLSPTTTGNFTAGVWSGNVAINQLATGITLASASAGGITGESNSFTVSGLPVLAVTPATGITATANFGGPATPSNASWTLSNTGTGTMNWSAAKTASWLTLSATGGTLTAGASTTVTATLDTSGLAPGGHTDTITFTNISTSTGTSIRNVALTVTLPAPVLAAEPVVTGGTGNTIAWNAVPGVTSYEAQAADNAAFTNALSSGWIAGANYTFTPLADGTAWHYRARSRVMLSGAMSSWNQTSQADFAADTATNVSTTATPGRVVLGPAATALTENFDQPGTAWSSTIFSTYSGTATRTDLTGIGPNTTPPLPVNQGGDLEGRLTTDAQMPSVPANFFSDGTIEAYVGRPDRSQLQHTGLHIRCTGQPSMLTGYEAIILFYTDGTAKADFSKIVNGIGTWFYTSTTAFSVADSDNIHMRFSASGSTLSLTLWRVNVSGGVVTETAIPFFNGTNTLTATDSTYTGGYAGLHHWASGSADMLVDDVSVSFAGSGYASSGTLVSPVIAPASFVRWGALSFHGDTSTAGTVLSIDVLDTNGTLLAANVADGTDLTTIPAVAAVSSIKLRANLGTTNSTNSPALDDWSVTWQSTPDASANSAWSTEVVSIQDATPPALTATSSSNASSPGYTLTGTAGDLSGVASVTVNGVTATTSDGFAHWSVPVTLATGANAFTIVAQDNAVPANVQSVIFTVTYSTTTDTNGNGLPDTWETSHGLTAADTALGDHDRDGLPNIVEYALDLDPASSDGQPGYWATNEVNPADGKRYLVLHYRRRLGLAGWAIEVQTSTNASQWTSAPGTCEEAQAPTLQPGGECEIAHMRVLQPIGSGGSAKAFVRLNIHSL